MLSEGGKSKLIELNVTSDKEEQMAKEYASTVEKLQIALKRERQIKIMKVTSEKEKVAVVRVLEERDWKTDFL